MRDFSFSASSPLTFRSIERIIGVMFLFGGTVINILMSIAALVAAEPDATYRKAMERGIKARTFSASDAGSLSGALNAWEYAQSRKYQKACRYAERTVKTSAVLVESLLDTVRIAEENDDDPGICIQLAVRGIARLATPHERIRQYHALIRLAPLEPDTLHALSGIERESHSKDEELRFLALLEMAEAENEMARDLLAISRVRDLADGSPECQQMLMESVGSREAMTQRRDYCHGKKAMRLARVALLESTLRLDYRKTIGRAHASLERVQSDSFYTNTAYEVAIAEYTLGLPAEDTLMKAERRRILVSDPDLRALLDAHREAIIQSIRNTRPGRIP